MNSEKLYYINSYANESQHEMINSALLIMFVDYFTDIKVYSGMSSWKKMEKKLLHDKDKITLKKLYVVPGYSPIANLFRYIISALYNIGILLFSEKEAVLVYNFNNVLSLFGLNFINKIVKRKILIFCHGELELLVDSSGGILARLLRYYCRHFFLNPSVCSSLYFCVLGESIKERLKPIIGKRIRSFISIDHPYIFSGKNVQIKSNSNFINIGTVGELNAFKGLYLYIELIESVRRVMQENPIQFSIIGRVTKEKDIFKKLGVKIPGENKTLLRADFDLSVSSLNYILFFYSNDKYQITASGAIFDAIKFRIPIIALRNVYFDYLFNKYGNIGYLCNSIEEMVNVILNLNDLNSCFCFDNYYNYLNPQAVSIELNFKMKQIFSDDIC